MGTFHQSLTESSASDTLIFSFPGDYLSKYQWIFNEIGMCISIVEI